jgi:hypothetical protein
VNYWTTGKPFSKRGPVSEHGPEKRSACSETHIPNSGQATKENARKPSTSPRHQLTTTRQEKKNSKSDSGVTESTPPVESMLAFCCFTNFRLAVLTQLRRVIEIWGKDSTGFAAAATLLPYDVVQSQAMVVARIGRATCGDDVVQDTHCGWWEGRGSLG